MPPRRPLLEDQKQRVQKFSELRADLWSRRKNSAVPDPRIPPEEAGRSEERKFGDVLSGGCWDAGLPWLRLGIKWMGCSFVSSTTLLDLSWAG
eukprot:2726643-Pyramimonas_sp.AAC.1